MSSGWMVFAELALVFGVVFGFGFYELYKLKQYRQSDKKHRANADDVNTQKTRQ